MQSGALGNGGTFASGPNLDARGMSVILDGSTRFAVRARAAGVDVTLEVRDQLPAGADRQRNTIRSRPGYVWSCWKTRRVRSVMSAGMCCWPGSGRVPQAGCLRRGLRDRRRVSEPAPLLDRESAPRWPSPTIRAVLPAMLTRCSSRTAPRRRRHQAAHRGSQPAHRGRGPRTGPGCFPGRGAAAAAEAPPRGHLWSEHLSILPALTSNEAAKPQLAGSHLSSQR
jgi:hypothetical protein